MCLMLNEYSEVDGDKEFLRCWLLLLFWLWIACCGEGLGRCVGFERFSSVSFLIVIGEFGLECFIGILVVSACLSKVSSDSECM